MRSRFLLSLLALIVVLPSSSLARVQCKPRQNECKDALRRCVLGSAKVLQCRAGKEQRCARAAERTCTKKVRRCCRRTPLDTCCGAGAYFTPTTTLAGGFSTTTTTSPSATTTTTPGAARCANSIECAGFACCNVAKGLCCVLGGTDPTNVAACSTPGEILAGSGGCTSNDGVDFPPTPDICGPSRPATCPSKAVAPVSFQCHVCADRAKIMQTFYNTETGERTSYP